MADLTFIKTRTISQFKEMMNADIIEVKTAREGKYFFTWGPGSDQTGACSKAPSLFEKPVISLCEGDDGEFYLMHEKGEGGAKVVATF
jgi:hypothetical protein